MVAEDVITVPDEESLDDEDEYEDEDGASAPLNAGHIRQTAGGAPDATDRPSQDRTDGRGLLAAERVPRSESSPASDWEVGWAFL